MTVPANEGVFGFGPQTAKSTVATTFYRHPATLVDLGGAQAVNQFPPELGGGLAPRGAFKASAFGAGQVTMHPRLESTVGLLLYAAAGKHSVVPDTPEAGVHRHIFTGPDAYSDMKWLTLRKYIPGSSAGENLGEQLLDARLVGLRLTVTPASILAMTATFVAREPALSDTGVDSWTWANELEHYSSVPITSKAGTGLKVDGTDMPATAITIDLANDYTDTQEELIVGSPYPDDFVILQQTLTVTFTYKWKDQVLYRQIVTGSNVETGGLIEWSPVPYSSDVEFIAESPGNISGHSVPYRLRVYAPEVVWRAAGPPRLVGGGWLAVDFVGVAQQQTGQPTFRIDLDNETADYVWS